MDDAELRAELAKILNREKPKINSRIVVLSVAYVIIILLVLLIMDAGLMWLLDKVILKMFNWFSELRFFWKLMLIVLGAYTLIFGIFQFFLALAKVLFHGVFYKLPKNIFTKISGIVLSAANSIWLIIIVWRLPTRWDFWIVVQILLLTGFFIALALVTMPIWEDE